MDIGFACPAGRAFLAGTARLVKRSRPTGPRPARRELAFVLAVAFAGLALVLLVAFAPWYDPVALGLAG